METFSFTNFDKKEICRFSYHSFKVYFTENEQVSTYFLFIPFTLPLSWLLYVTAYIRVESSLCWWYDGFMWTQPEWSGRLFGSIERVSCLTRSLPLFPYSPCPVGPGELYFGDGILPLVLSNALPNFGNDWWLLRTGLNPFRLYTPNFSRHIIYKLTCYICDRN